jgi:hypothetical protein
VGAISIDGRAITPPASFEEVFFIAFPGFLIAARTMPN